MKCHKYVGNCVCWVGGGGLCALPGAAMAVDVAAVTGESVPIAVGETRKVQIIRNGEEMWRMALRLSENQLDVTRSDGCKISRTIDDIYGPNSELGELRQGAMGYRKNREYEEKWAAVAASRR
jgi:hypothetical protein